MGPDACRARSAGLAVLALACATAAAGVGAAPVHAHRLTLAPPSVMVGAVSAGAAAAATVTQTSVGISRTPDARPLPSDYVGVALTYKPVPGWVGPPSEPVDPVLVALLRNLAPHGEPLVRIGGESADHSWWPVSGYRKPFGITYDLTPAWTTAARRLAQAAHAKLMLGLNLQADRPRLVAVESHQLLARIGARYIQSFQLGNEPNLYTAFPWYKRLHGRPVPAYSDTGTPVYARPRSYAPADYAREVSRMLPVLPRVAIAGPETNAPAWMQAFTRFLGPAGPAEALTTHAYAGVRCVKDPSDPLYPSIPHLLSPAASRGQLDGLERDVDLAHRHDDDFRVDELGTVSCSGQDGVSDSMASALWVLDTLFALDEAGVDGVNLHSVKGVNALFSLGRSRGRWQATVAPWYYGALMFTQAAPAGSRLLPVAGGTQPDTRTWATLGPDRRVRVLVINDSTGSSAQVVVRNPAGHGRAAASLAVLRAPSASATDGVTLGGRSFGTTTTGRLATPRTTQIQRHGAYTIDLPPASAGLLTLQKGN
jgi:hypothetical protein